MTGERILIVSPGDTRSGAGQFRHSLACALRRAGYAVAIAQPEEQGPLQAKEAALGIEHHAFSRNPYASVTAFGHDHVLAAAELQRSAPDLVVFSSGVSPVCQYSFMAATAAGGIPYVVIEHQVSAALFTFKPAIRDDFTRLYRDANAVIAVSEENLATLRRCLALPDRTGKVILCGRPEAFFRPRDEVMRAECRREWGVPDDALVALTVAKLEPIKGHRFLIAALQRLKADGLLDKVFSVWIGDGVARPRLERRLAEAGLGDRVRLLGHRFDVAPLYDAGDVLVMTSVSEGMPLTVMEAMAKGLPPVCTDVGGTAEAIRDAGIVLPPPVGDGRTVSGLAAALRLLQADRARLAALSARARHRAAALFREDRMIEEHLDVIRQALARPRVRDARPDAAPQPTGRGIFPTAHPARALIVSFYGDGEAVLGPALLDFFDTVPILGPRSELCRLMTEHNSDKGSGRHNYTLLYHFLFKHLRHQVEHLFEVGIGTNYTDMPSNMTAAGSPGASLRGWRDYFPRAVIIGADIDQRILFTEDRISTHHVDQLDKTSIAAMWDKIAPTNFDIMIDDGLHTFDANARFFASSFHKLRKYGYYFVEDIIVSQENLQKYHDFFAEFGAPGAIVKLPHTQNGYDNCIGIFKAGRSG